jgi:hypothetical protein
MEAEPVYRERVVLAETLFAELVVWRVPEPVRGSDHWFKYRLALISEGACVLRYDNEAGKGDHRHIGGHEEGYQFVDIARLLADFWDDVEVWRSAR